MGLRVTSLFLLILVGWIDPQRRLSVESAARWARAQVTRERFDRALESERPVRAFRDGSPMTETIMRITLTVALVGAVQCSEDPPVGPEVYALRPTVEHYDFHPITVDGIEGVIVPASVLQARTLALGAWTPTAQDVRAFERSGCAQKRVDKCMARAARSRNETYVAGQYVRRYMGSVEPWEGRVISAHLMCERLDGWQNRFVSVPHGGCCYLDAFYNVDKNECMSFNPAYPPLRAPRPESDEDAP